MAGRSVIADGLGSGAAVRSKERIADCFQQHCALAARALGVDSAGECAEAYLHTCCSIAVEERDIGNCLEFCNPMRTCWLLEGRVEGLNRNRAGGCRRSRARQFRQSAFVPSLGRFQQARSCPRAKSCCCPRGACGMSRSGTSLRRTSKSRSAAAASSHTIRAAAGFSYLAAVLTSPVRQSAPALKRACSHR